MENLIVRKAVEDDAVRMAELEKICFATPWSENSLRREIRENSIATYIVAENEGLLVGYAGVWKILDEGHITNVAVDPDFRDKKIATSVIGSLIRVAEADGIDKYTLEVRVSNAPAIALYKKYDFKEVGIRKGYYEDNGEDAIIMWRKDEL